MLLNVHNSAAMKLGKINVSAGTDTNKIIMVIVNPSVKKVTNLIIKLKLIAKKFVHGIISMKENGINVSLAQRTVFGSQAGMNADVMEDMKKFMENAS